jgi:hypothetical protein
MTGNAHHFGGLHPGFDHSRDGGMAEVMESQAFNFCGLTSCGKPIFEIVLDSEDESFHVFWGILVKLLQFRFQP